MHHSLFNFISLAFIFMLNCNKKVTVKIHNTFQLPLKMMFDLIGRSGPEVSLGGRPGSQARDSSSLPLPPTLVGAIRCPSTVAKDSPSVPAHCPAGAEESGGGGGTLSPTPVVGSAGLSYHLNPTTLAMLQQHNYIPYFRGIKARWDQPRSGPIQTVDNLSELLLMSNPRQNQKPSSLLLLFHSAPKAQFLMCSPSWKENVQTLH